MHHCRAMPSRHGLCHVFVPGRGLRRGLRRRGNPSSRPCDRRLSSRRMRRDRRRHAGDRLRRRSADRSADRSVGLHERRLQQRHPVESATPHQRELFHQRGDALRRGRRLRGVHRAGQRDLRWHRQRLRRLGRRGRERADGQSLQRRELPGVSRADEASATARLRVHRSCAVPCGLRGATRARGSARLAIGVSVAPARCRRARLVRNAPAVARTSTSRPVPAAAASRGGSRPGPCPTRSRGSSRASRASSAGRAVGAFAAPIGQQGAQWARSGVRLAPAPGLRGTLRFGSDRKGPNGPDRASGWRQRNHGSGTVGDFAVRIGQKGTQWARSAV